MDRKRFCYTFGALIFVFTVACYFLYGLKTTGASVKVINAFANCAIQTGASSVSSFQTNDSDNLTVIHQDLFNYLAASLNNTIKYPGIGMYISYTTTLLRLKPLPNVEPIRKDLGPAINDVTSFLFPIQIAKCTEKIESANKSIFIAVVSAPGNFERREHIRKTWFNHLKDSFYHRDLVDFVGFGFFLGKTSDSDIQYQIEKEADLHKDIIQVDMIDDYYLLGKKAAALFYWIENNCAGVDFVLKMDDDVYVNVRNLATTVALQLSPFSNSIYGQSAGNLFPAREGKWMVDVETWPWKDYPNYFVGPCVLIPGKKIKLMLAATQTTPFFRIDDIYLTGLCRSQAKVQLRRSPTFFRMGLNGVPEPCYVRESVSWLTSSTEQKFASYNATNRFYRNESQCILPEQTAVNPDDVVSIEFFPLL